MNKKLIATVVAALAIGTGVSFAQEGGPGNGPSRDHNRAGLAGLVHDISTVTGLSVADIRNRLADGQTMADLITANGGNVESVTADLIATLTEQINARVTLGQITQERADRIIEQLPQQVADVLNSTTPVRDGLGRGEGRPMGGMRPDQRGEILDQLMIATGMNRTALLEAFASGQTAVDLLTEADVTVESFVDTLLVSVEERLAERVASGQINQAIADARLALVRAELNFHLSNADTTD